MGRYRIRYIPFLEADAVPVLVQDLPGPCPLLAIANFLFLMGKITLRSLSNNSVSIPSSNVLNREQDRTRRAIAMYSEKANASDARSVSNPNGWINFGEPQQEYPSQQFSTSNLYVQKESISFEEIVWLLQCYLQERCEKLIMHKETNTLNNLAKLKPDDINYDSRNIGHTAFDESSCANLLQNIEDALQLIPKIENGIDVNVVFSSVTAFEFTPEIALFDAFGIELVHGWVYDPAVENLKAALGEQSYNSLSTSLFAETDEKRDEENPEIVKLRLVKSFLVSTNQLTEYGVQQLLKLPSHRLYVFFRNNHFSLLSTYPMQGDWNNSLHELVTSSSLICDSPLIVWSTLNVSNDIIFLDAFGLIPSEEETANAKKHNMDRYQQVYSAAYNKELARYNRACYDAEQALLSGLAVESIETPDERLVASQFFIAAVYYPPYVKYMRKQQEMMNRYAQMNTKRLDASKTPSRSSGSDCTIQ